MIAIDLSCLILKHVCLLGCFGVNSLIFLRGHSDSEKA